MTEQPKDKPKDKQDGEVRNFPRQPSLDDGEVIDRIIKRVSGRHQEIAHTNVMQTREDTRKSITEAIVWGFSVLLVIFAIWGCLLLTFGEPARFGTFLDFFGKTFAVIMPIITLILGFYLPTKAAD